MKSILRLLLLNLVFTVSTGAAFAESGIFESFLILNLDDSGNTYYDLQASTDNPDFHGADLGDFSCYNTLVLNGAQNKTFKNGSDDILGSNLFYRVYLQGETPGEFFELVLPFSSEVPSGGSVDQTWENAGANINLLAGLNSGTYVIEVFTNSPFQFSGGSGTHFSSNSGANFQATFTIETPGVANMTELTSSSANSFCTDFSLTVDANGSASVTVDDLYDGFFDVCPGVEVEIEIPVIEFSCNDIGPLAIQVTATDSLGNQAVCVSDGVLIFEVLPSFEIISGCGCDSTQAVQLLGLGGINMQEFGARCISCPEGWFNLPGTVTCAESEGPGFYMFGDGPETLSAECPPGSFCPDGFNIYPCPAGTFSSEGGASTCDACPQGTFQPEPGQEACLVCEQGATNGGVGATDCLECLPGNFQQVIDGITVCMPCPAGSFCPDGVVQTLCPAGTFSDQIGQIECQSCAAGSFNPEPGATSCLLCPGGTFQASEGSVLCIPCAPGTANDQIGQDACAACPVGTFSSESGQLICEPCENGSFNNESGSTACIECPPGFYQETLDGITVCTICPPGSFCPDGIVIEDCPPGSFTAVEGAAECLLCQPGSFSADFGSTFCASCPAGTFSDISGADTCESCPAGEFQPNAGSVDCLACPSGSFTNTTGSTACVDCPLGSFQVVVDGVIECAPCPPGSYCPDGVNALLCEAGTFSDVEGSTFCVACTAGSASTLEGSTSCTLCPPGSFSASDGAATCLLCPNGTAQPDFGQTSCADCENGNTGGAGSAICISCPTDVSLPVDENCSALVPDLTNLVTILHASTGDFSGTQGDVWQYGMYPFGGYTAYQPLPNWTGFVWNNPGTILDFPQLDANGGHPELDDAARMAVRRWTSTVSGTVRVFGDFFDRDTNCGDGVNVRIYKNGVQFYEYLNVPGNSVPYSENIEVAVGDHIDFVIDRKFDGGCDDTHFTNNIDQTIIQTQSPEAGTVITEPTSVTITSIINGLETTCLVNIGLDATGGALEAVCNETVSVFLDENGAALLSANDVNNGSTVACGDPILSLSQTAFSCADILTESSTVGVSELFISEYVEGSGVNKCIEIYNGTGADVDLSTYSLLLYFNGNSSAGPPIALQGTIQNNTTFVICNVSAVPALLAVADQTSGSLSFNGDDAVALNKDGMAIDIIGQIGTDPGSQWGSGLTSTANNTLRRKANVLQGDSDGSDAFDPSTEWDGFAQDAFDGLGSHSISLPEPEVLSVVLTVSDVLGNNSSCTAQIQVIDDLPPVVLCQEVTLMLDENGQASLTEADVDGGSTDNCGETTLSLDRTDFSCADLAIAPQEIGEVAWINEFHYDNDGADVNEFVEVVANFDASQYEILLYNGSNGTLYATISLGAAVSTDGDYNFYIVQGPSSGIQNGAPDGIALLDAAGNVLETLAYEGSFSATNGPADGIAFDDIGVEETGATPEGSSLQKAGIGIQGSSFEWAGPTDDTPGALNAGQSFPDGNGVSVTLTATDASGNQSSCAVAVNVVDEMPPIAVCQDLTVVLDAQGAATIQADQIDNGSSDNCGVGSISIDRENFGCADIGEQTVMLTVTDLSGNTSSCSATITVVDGMSPSLTCSTVTLELGADGTAVLNIGDVANATDNCGVVELSASQTEFSCADLGGGSLLPTDLFISEYVEGSSNNKYIEVFNGTGAPVNLANYELRLYSNGASTPNSNNNLGFAGTLEDGEVAVFANGNAAAFNGTVFNATAVAFNGDDAVELFNATTNTSIDVIGVIGEDPGSSWVQAGNSTLNQTLRRNPEVISGNIAGTTGFPSLGTAWTGFDTDDVSGLGSHSIETVTGAITVAITAADASGNTATCDATVILEDNIAPVALCANIDVPLDATGNAVITPEMLNGGSNDNCEVAEMSIDVAAFSCADIGSNAVTLTVADISGNASTCQALVNVVDILPPALECQNISLSLDENGTVAVAATDFVASATDNCGPVSLAIETTSFDCSNLGANTVVVTATDPSGNAVNCEAVLTITDDTVPSVLCQDIEVELDATGLAIITAANVVMNAMDNCGIASLSIDQETFDCANIGVNTVVVTATDQNGNSATCDAVVTIVDNAAPVLNCQAISISLDENGEASIGEGDVIADVSDNCGLVTVSLGVSTFNCENIGVNTVQVTAVDDAGNTTTCEAEVTVEDDLPPVLVCNDLDIFINEMGFAEASLESLVTESADNCGEPALEILSGRLDYSCDDEGLSFDVEILSTDASGNQSTCTATITVLPSEAADDPCGEPPVECSGIEGIVDADALCDEAGTFPGGWFNANQGIVYCFDGMYSGGHINITNGSTVRLSGTGTIGVTVGWNATLEILDGAEITFSNLSVNWGANGMVVYPDATVHYDNTFAPNSDVVNCGNFNTKRLQVNFNGSFTNNGNLHVYSPSATAGINGDLVNNGNIEVNGKMALYFTGHILNNCRIAIDDNFFVHRNLDNYSFVEVGETTLLFFTGRVNQFDGAMFETESTIIFGKYTGSGDPSLVKVLDATLAFWTGRIEGALFYCDEDGLELVIGSNLFQNGALDDCGIDVEVDDCNPRGHIGFAKSNGNISDKGKDAFDISDFAHLLDQEALNEASGHFEMNASVWPNPANGNAMFSISEADGSQLIVELYDANGRLIQKLHDGQTMRNQPFSLVLDLNHLENGLYLIRAVSDQGAATLRLINAK